MSAQKTHQRCLCMVVMELDLSFVSEGFIGSENKNQRMSSYSPLSIQFFSKDELIDNIVGFLQVAPSPVTYNQTVYNPQKHPGHTETAFLNTYCSNL